MTEDANERRFDALANEWDSDPQRVHQAQKVARAMRQALAPAGTERVLEFGAGTGLATLLLAPKVGHLTAMDASAGMLEVLRGKLALRKLEERVTVRRGSVPGDLPDGPFDLICSAMTLHHVEDVPALFAALHARLEPGGRVALADLDAEDGSFHGEGAEGVRHHGFARSELEGWLRAAGFVDAAFSTAFTVRRESEGGGVHEYPIFLVVAARPATG